MMLREIVTAMHFEAGLDLLRESQTKIRQWGDIMRAHQLNERERFRVPCEATTAPEVIEDE